MFWLGPQSAVRKMKVVMRFRISIKMAEQGGGTIICFGFKAAFYSLSFGLLKSIDSIGWLLIQKRIYKVGLLKGKNIDWELAGTEKLPFSTELRSCVDSIYLLFPRHLKCIFLQMRCTFLFLLLDSILTLLFTKKKEKDQTVLIWWKQTHITNNRLFCISVSTIYIHISSKGNKLTVWLNSC